MSLVTRLLVLIVLAMIPVFAAQIYTELELQQSRREAASADAVRYARLVSDDAARVFEGVKGILIAVSQTPLIRRLNVSECADYLAGLAQRYPQILNITLIDEKGTPLCANTPSAPGASAADRFYFQEAKRLGDFVVGEYIVGRTIPAPQLPVALSFADDAGRRLVISIGIKFDWLQQHFGNLALPPGARLWITDRNGTLVVAPSAPALLGQKLPAELRPALSSHEGTFETSHDDELRTVGYEGPELPPVGLIVAVELSHKSISMAERALFERDIAVLLIALLTTVVVSWIGGRRWIVRPLQALTDAASEWGEGNYEARARISDRGSEVGRLARAFDRMVDTIQADQEALQSANETLEQRVAERTKALSDANHRLETEMGERQALEATLRQSQKMEAIGQLTGGIAHDFNNLLTAIGGSIEFLARSVPASDERARRYYAMGRESVERAARMTHRLLAFARQQPLEIQAVDLNRLVASMSELLSRTLGDNIAVETVLAGGLWLTRTDPVQVENSLLNLAINSRDAMPQGGKLTIETANAYLDPGYAAANEVEPGQYVMLAVTDTGTGMSTETVSRAFDPFFTTKPVGKGTGLGLSMIYGFAKQSGGHIKIYSEVGRGTTIKLYLPRADAATEAGSFAGAEETSSATEGATVLVVEDDETVRELTISFLHDLGYATLAAPDAATALDLLRRHPDVAVLFTDVVLAGEMDGRRLAEQATQEHPGLKALFTTGYTPNAIIHGGILDQHVRLLPKPFSEESLGAMLRRILGSSESW